MVNRMNGKVKFGVRIHQRNYTFESLKRIWQEADRLGYHSATLFDLLNGPLLECWTTLSALAAVTERIRLTPIVLANTYRPPALLAKMASTLDVISGGRLELGIGAGGAGETIRPRDIPFRPLAFGFRCWKSPWRLSKDCGPSRKQTSGDASTRWTKR